ncbi:uncharacterized protein F4822DRAFT_251419 [Hypoxylon trugodes]|uniref:uncharacterized protein n=1 Tax=Hypoxylon trugodes TaxID=326681 RepID=UPI00219ABD97|nr:uncharacterized protein F4822DRAFT_251419 [Hypoxylon trugodes]KAI1388607.1 hypothetical protein F4822DRAFT_251419 [Hypoxylon trugodes]
MTSPIPTPRQFLTSLINSLTSHPPTTAATHPTIPNTNTSPNPLKQIPPIHRPLLTTLYVLYPLTLLPALDLLDRRLATRILIQPSPTTITEAHARLPKKGADIYIVRSAQPQHPRRGGGEPSSTSGLSYVVRLDAWNCTCAAFAFAAFPREEVQRSYVIELLAGASRVGQDERLRDEEGEGRTWQFGSLSVDGTEGSGIAGVPCCKHLLACVLAERWGGLLGGYVEERVVGREEAAGLVADI